MTATAQTPATPAKQPEMKLGPFAGGISITIWRNTVEAEEGPRDIRSIRISPRRYRDEESHEWRDGAYRTSDLGVLILALQAAQQFMTLHPLPQAAEEEPPEAQEGQDGTPF